VSPATKISVAATDIWSRRVRSGDDVLEVTVVESREESEVGRDEKGGRDIV
jgi:hypothetical protein